MYVYGLIKAIGLGMIFSGAGIALCGPIFGWLMADAHVAPHTPLHVREHDQLHELVVGRVMSAGLVLTAMGVVLAAAGRVLERLEVR
jgi:hypothetical protein